MMSVLSFTLRSEDISVGRGLLPVVATGDQISKSKLKLGTVLYYIMVQLFVHVLLGNNETKNITKI